MINFNSISVFLLLICSIILPIYPNSSTFDFGGHIDVSLVYLILLSLLGINKTRVFNMVIILMFYCFLTNLYGFIELGIKITVFYIFIKYFERFFWKNLQNETLMISLFLSLFYIVCFIFYEIVFDITLSEYLSFVYLPFIYNFFISVILLIIIKYTSWPKVTDQVYRF